MRGRDGEGNNPGGGRVGREEEKKKTGEGETVCYTQVWRELKPQLLET